MRLYEQAVTEAKTGQAAAAQAQYRLGVCYYKKKDFSQATAAFDKLLKDFPGQKELAARATQYLYDAAPLRPPPWQNGEELRLDYKTAAGVTVGFGSMTVKAGETNGQKTWCFGMRSCFSPLYQCLSRVQALAANCKPLSSTWKTTWAPGIETLYQPGYAEVTVQGTEASKKIELPAAVYDNEQMIQVMRRLPLTTNYSINLVNAALNSSTAERSLAPYGLEVTAVEQVQVPAGVFECFKIENTFKETYWYSTDAHRYLVKANVQSGMVWELSAVHQYPPGEPVRYQDPVLGFSLTAPPGWLFDRHVGEDLKAERQYDVPRKVRDNPKAQVTVSIFGPELGPFVELILGRLEDLKANAKRTPEVRDLPILGSMLEDTNSTAKALRVWAEADIAQTLATVPGATVDTNSWRELTITGLPAVSVSGEIKSEKLVSCGIWFFDGTNTVKAGFGAPTEQFEAVRPKLEAIVESYQHSK